MEEDPLSDTEVVHNSIGDASMAQRKGGISDLNTQNVSSKQSYQEQIETLLNQLKINEEYHAKALKEHQAILAEKEKLIQEKKAAIENIKRMHEKKLESMTLSQQQTLSSCRMQHEKETAKLKWRLEQQEKESKTTAVEQLLNDFEQEQHTLRVENTETHFNKALAPSLNMKIPTTTKNTPYISTLYIPTYAISWPAPPPLSSLRKTSLVCSKEDYIQQ
ncbi:hypothetical protein BC941DRAFT_466764 [Chlamydoabsidia padenii]|nr:hypothetical protein BC941DRAFT_466764 [Chlamydoabsidia padenii]